MIINSLTYIPAPEEKGQTGLGWAAPVKAINAVPHSFKSKRKSDVSFPVSRGFGSLGKGWAGMKWLRALLASAYYDAWSEWNHSVKPFGDAGKNKAHPNLHLWAQIQNVLLWRHIHFLWHVSFSPHSLRGQRSLWHIAGSWCCPWKLLSCLPLISDHVTFQESVHAVDLWIIPSCTRSCSNILFPH